ncbi:lactate dehydrogenase [Lachnospiraceae bacterium ZAX-1]
MGKLKIFVYSCRDDEYILFEEYREKWNLELSYCKSQPTLGNADLAKGYTCITIVGTVISDELLYRFYELGVRMIATRSIGVDHINLKLAAELGIRFSNLSYSPNAVADFAIMLMLMCLRKAKYILEHYKVNDYALARNRGRELRDMTVGVVGGGRIGRTVMKELTGFGCELLVYDNYHLEEVKEYATYVGYDELLGRADILTVHAPGTDGTHHMLNMENVKKLKKGVIVINTSRGSNIDNKALIYGIEKEIISAVGIDVIDHEPVIYNVDHKDSLYIDHDVAVLESYPNVIITPHTAFFTDHAVRDMVEHALHNCVCFLQGKEIPDEIKSEKNKPRS